MKVASGIKYIIGIDEAGRGPLAGPVAVGVCVVPSIMTRKNFRNIRDSKKLTEKMRDRWFKKMQALQTKSAINFSVTLVSNKIIDDKGLTFSIKSAMHESLNSLRKKIDLNPAECLVLLDGSLRAPAEFIHQKTIIKGDEKEFSISLASIAAKVTRDAYMKNASKEYPKYNFESHKGYGTPGHVAIIKKSGPCDLHRVSFMRRIAVDNPL